jgi:hypothetical protein
MRQTQTIEAHTFLNTVTGLEMTVYTEGNESAFVAIVHELKAHNMPVEYVWKLQGSRSRRLVGRPVLSK